MPGDAGHFDFEGARFGVRKWAASTTPVERQVGSPFILVHGFAQNACSWNRIAPALASEARANVYALDLMGHGESDRPDSGRFYDIDFQAQAVLAFCELVAQAEGAPPVLVGYSMGGRVALCAAERAGENTQDGPANAPFRALVLESAGLGPADSDERAVLAKRNAGWAARLREEGVAPFMEYWESLSLFESQRSLDAATRVEVASERLANDANALALTFEHAGAHAMPARPEAVRALRALVEAGIPVTYLAGALDAKYRAVAESLETELGRAIRTRIVLNAGHNVHLEQPEVFASELLDLAGSCPPAAF